MEFNGSNISVTLVSEGTKTRAAANLRRRKTVKILCGILIPVVVLTIFLSVILNPTYPGVPVGSVDGAYGTVLADIDGIVEANPRIIDIAMLGAHDANSFSLKAENPVDYKDKDGILGKIKPISAGFQYRFAVTQTVPVGPLLLQGARFLQLKYTNYEGVWRATHSIIGRELKYDVLEILEYLAGHRGEVVVVLFQPSYFGEESYDTFHNWLATVKYEGRNIYDYVGYEAANVFGDEYGGGVCIDELRYNDVTLNGTSSGVVLLNRREEGVESADTAPSAYSDLFFDMDANAAHRWHSRIGSDVLVEEISEYCGELSVQRLYRHFLRVNQTQAAFSGATFGDVLRDIGEWSLLKFARKHNLALLENENFDRWLEIMPVFQVDYANSNHGDFNARVNAKIRMRNEEIVRILLQEGATYEDLYR